MTADELFSGLAVVLPPILDDELGGRRDVCILGTHITVEAARYFGVDCKPAVTLVRAVNEAFVDYVAVNGAVPTVEQMRGTALYTVGCDGNRKTVPGWPFHLIARAGDLAFDSTSGQLHRPHANIRVPRTLCFEWKQDALRACANLEDGALIYYQAVHFARDYKQTIDWRRPLPKRLIGDVIRRLNDKRRFQHYLHEPPTLDRL